MEFLIRQARLEDGETLSGIDHIGGFDLASELRVGGAWVMVALCSGEFIGFVLFRGVLGGMGDGFIDSTSETRGWGNA